MTGLPPRRGLAMLAACLFAWLLSLPMTGHAETTRVSDLRTRRLAKGVNLPGWFWLTRKPVGALERRYPDADFRLIERLGLTHVRVPVDMANVYAADEPTLLNPAHLAYLDRGIRHILSHDLAIIVDLHSISQKEGGSNYSGPLGTEPAFTDRFCRFWNAFAQHLSRFDPDRLLLEPMNEPVLRGNEAKWPPIQRRVIAAIRRGASQHTVLATGARWSNLDTLLELEPLDDPNIIYNFHFYEPHIFTHQGASWSSDWVKALRNIPYPSSPEAVRQLLETGADRQSARHIQHYGQQRWNAAKVEGRLRLASEWAKRHGVPVICDEFGTYKRYCPPAYRVAWLRDVRKACETSGIGWCMWTFDGNFGLVDRKNGAAVVDPDVAKALGLNVE